MKKDELCKVYIDKLKKVVIVYLYNNGKESNNVIVK